MGILDEALRAPSKAKEQVGPAIAKLPPDDQEEVHTAIFDPNITDVFVADYLTRHTGKLIKAGQVSHYARHHLGRKQEP